MKSSDSSGEATMMKENIDNKKENVSAEQYQAESSKAQNTLGITPSMEETCATQEYTIIKLLGRGSYGAVYLCKGSSRAGGKRYALKVIDTLKAHRQYVDKFLQRELDILLRVNHPFIIYVRSMVHRNNKFYIFMRYAEQGDLLEYLVRSGRLPEPRCRLWAGQIALALHYLHSKQIAHRDLKCENILITSHGNTKLSDFGFAISYTLKNGKPTLCTTFCGTRHYASPEILSSTPYDPEKTDTWAYGVVLYVMLNGSVPFPSNSPKKILEYQYRGNVQMKVGVKVTEEVLILFRNIFDLNPSRRWGTQTLLGADWFRMGQKNRKSKGAGQKHHYYDQPGLEESERKMDLLMAGETYIFFPKLPSSYQSKSMQIPSFMYHSGAQAKGPEMEKDRIDETRKPRKKYF